jgi:uncharacterized protein (DUF1684 family)
MKSAQEIVDLVDWRRRVGDLYRLQDEDRLIKFRECRDDLFRSHPQSPLSEDQRRSFAGLRYFAPDSLYRLNTTLKPSRSSETLQIETGGEDGTITYQRVGTVDFGLAGQSCSLTVFWMRGYGGGLFLPFRDATSGKETYGGGRYLFDTVKNTDGLSLEVNAGSLELTIDFNYGYNPSCAYNPRWLCPLAPRENWLTVPIRAGEMDYRSDA